ncbi:MAG TPA: SBBP repeat-containing protein, partial [Emticicia sp.]
MKKLFYSCVLIILFIQVQAQNVTITPDGITPVVTHPRISYDAILALPNPQEGDLAYDTTFKCLRVYSDGKWLCTYQDPTNYTPNMTALVSVKGPMFENNPSIGVDALGNFYILGMYSGSVTFGTNTFTSSGHSDMYIAKYNKSGALQWAQSAGGASGELGAGIAVDANGNVYITGGFQGTATFGTGSVTSAGSLDIFVTKYNTNGVFQWVQSAGSTGDDVGGSIALDGSGNIYLTGYYTNTATFGTFSVSSQSFSADVFVAKCNTNGAFQWVKSAGGAGSDSGAGIGVDATGNIYVTGSYAAIATFGGTQVTSNGNLDIFLAKYDNSGAFQWVKSAGGTSYDSGADLAVDSEGNIYITGSYWETISFGTNSITSQGSRDIFIAGYDGNGNAIWAKSAGGTQLEGAWGIAVDEAGVYITGHYSSPVSFGSKTITPNGTQYDILVAKYTKSTGNFAWVQTAGGAGKDEGTAIAVDNSGNVYVIGNFAGTATFGKITKTAIANWDV